MKIFILIFALFLSWPAYAADNTNTTETDKTSPEKKADAADSAADKNAQETKEDELSCQYYKVDLPSGWKVIKKPTEEQGTVNAIFAKTNGPVVTMIIGPRRGADPKIIVDMFAQQFKAAKTPVEKNGQYFFSFPEKDPVTQQEISGNVCISFDDDDFMVTKYNGSQKEVQQFIKNNVISKDYADLMPNL